MNKGQLDTDKQKQLEDLGVVWDLFNHQWENYFNLLVKYKEREGHCNVPQSHEEDGENLGTWLNKQRGLMNKGKLDTVKQKLLEDIGVVWAPLQQKWENNFSLLLKYKDREGHCNVPSRHKEDRENLGAWLNRQRVLNNKGQLDTVKQKQLEDIGVVWDVLQQQWENYYNLLVKYNKRKDHCNVPDKHEEDGEKLGKWLSNQRTANKKGKINTDLIKRLNEVGVVWSIYKSKSQ
mmetsp:Transcript_30831/g.31341  ORF Transcript_30831/g.31341 Transcript_30831/m.31341 type:complete len:234 (+) Transcript_30831:348-1049(+)